VNPEVVAFVALFGLLVGSFLNVVISRLQLVEPEDRDLGGRSRCPQCRAQIAWYDNIPLVSWVVLGAKCRHCKQRIPARYPLVEALTAVLWALVAAASPDWRTVAPGLVLMGLLVPLTFIDLDVRLLPNKLTYPGTVAGLALSIGLGPQHRFQSHHLWWLEVVLSALGAGGFLLAAALIRPGGMGLGDVKLATMMGAFLGAAVAPAMFAGFILALLPSIWLLLRHGRRARKMGIPFGPFLAAGTVLGWFFGHHVLALYLHGFHG
jgi:leader peptidase (prepilin peptidase)/N-methyltransferase